MYAIISLCSPINNKYNINIRNVYLYMFLTELIIIFLNIQISIYFVYI